MSNQRHLWGGGGGERDLPAERGDAPRRGHEPAAASVAVSGSSVSGSVIGFVKKLYLYGAGSATGSEGPAALEISEEERAALEAFREECRLSQEWERAMTRTESIRLSSDDAERIEEHLPAPLRALVTAGDAAGQTMRLLVVMRWHRRLEEPLLAALRSAGKEEEWRLVEESPQATPTDLRCGLSTDANLPRLRIALRSLRGKNIDRLPAASLDTLCHLECLTPSEWQQVKDRRVDLSELLLNKHQPELDPLRSFLLLRHPDVHESLLRQYLDTSSSLVAERYLHGVPHLPRLYVHRQRLEADIARWLVSSASAVGDFPLLSLQGMGSSGKSYLAICAAHAALTRGFHRVVWVHGGGGGRIEREVKNVMEDSLATGDQVLLVVDDFRPSFKFDDISRRVRVLLTTRHRRIETAMGEVQEIEVDSLSAEETEELIRAVLRCDKAIPEDAFRRLQQPDLWDQVVRLCRCHHNMPLSCNVVVSIVKRGHEQWYSSEENFFLKLERDLEEAKKTLDSKLPRTATDYDHSTIYAALYVSVQRLSSEDKEKYLKLSIFERNAVILPVTMASCWSMTETEATALLEHFWKCAIISDWGHSSKWKQKSFALHDLLFELIQIVTSSDDRMRWKRETVTAYCSSSVPGQVELRPIDEEDMFYYSSFVRLCEEAEMAEVGARCVCRLGYVMTRVRLQLAHQLQEDIRTLRAKLPSDARLQAFDRLLASCLTSAVDRGDPDIVLRAALARHVVGDFDREARAIIDESENEGKLFLVPVRAPFERQLSGEVRLGRGEALTSVSSVDIHKALSGILIGCSVTRDGDQLHKLLFYRFGQGHSATVERVCSSGVVCVRFLDRPKMTCLVVMETESLVMTIRESDGGLDMAVRRSRAGVECRQDHAGRCVAADLREGTLWMLKRRSDGDADRCSALRYEVSDGEFVLKTEFPCKGLHHDRIAVDWCGYHAVVSSTGRGSGVVELFSRHSLESQYPFRGEVVGFLDHRRLALLQDEGLCVIEVDKSGRTVAEGIVGFESAWDTFVVENIVAEVDRRSQTCRLWKEGWEEVATVPLPYLPPLPPDRKSFVHCTRAGEIIIFDSSPSALCFSRYSMTDVEAYATAAAACHLDVWGLRCLQWTEDLDDFVFLSRSVSRRRTSIRRLLGNAELCPMEEGWQYEVSACRRSVAVAGDEWLKEWSIGGDVQQHIDLNRGRGISSICYSDRDLYAVVWEEDSGHLLYRVSEGELMRIFAVDDIPQFDSRRQLIPLFDCGPRSTLWVCDSSQSVIWMRRDRFCCRVWSLQGEPRLHEVGVQKCRVSADRRRLVMRRAGTATAMWKLQEYASDLRRWLARKKDIIRKRLKHEIYGHEELEWSKVMGRAEIDALFAFIKEFLRRLESSPFLGIGDDVDCHLLITKLHSLLCRTIYLLHPHHEFRPIVDFHPFRTPLNRLQEELESCLLEVRRLCTASELLSVGGGLQRLSETIESAIVDLSRLRSRLESFRPYPRSRPWRRQTVSAEKESVAKIARPEDPYTKPQLSEGPSTVAIATSAAPTGPEGSTELLAPRPSSPTPAQVLTQPPGHPQPPTSRGAQSGPWTVAVWDLHSQSFLFVWGDRRVVAAVPSPSGSALAFMDKDGVLRVATERPHGWEVEVERRLAMAEASLLSVTDDGAVLVRKDDQLFVVRKEDGDASLVWDWRWIDEGARPRRWRTNVVANPRGTAVAGCSHDSGGKIFAVRSLR